MGHIKVSNRPALFLTNSLGLGGSEKKTVDVVNALHRAGLDVHMAYLTRRELIRDRVDSTVPLICLDRTGKISMAAVRHLSMYVASNGIAKVICVNLYPMLYAMVATRRSEVAVVTMVNATDLPGWKSKMQMLVYWSLLRNVDELVFGCHFQRREWQRRFRLERVRCSVIYNGVDTKRFAPGSEIREKQVLAEEWGIGESDFVIGAVGNLRPEKNHLELITAVSTVRTSVSSLKVLLVGDGPERTKLERAVKHFGLSKEVIFAGRVNDVRPMLELMDVFVLPSTSDTFSNAALEAMAMGKPVVLSSRGGSGEMVESGKDGLIYAGGSRELAQLLTDLAHDPHTRKRYGAAARQTVLSRFSFERMVAAYNGLLADTSISTR